MFARQDRFAADRRGLRALLKSFDAEPERLLEQTMRDPAIRHNVGKCIGYAMVKPYTGEK